MVKISTEYLELVSTKLIPLILYISMDLSILKEVQMLEIEFSMLMVRNSGLISGEYSRQIEILFLKTSRFQQMSIA